MHRIAFDPSLPVVAASAFMARGRSFAAGEHVDWRALGVTEQTLYDWWRVGHVSHVAAPAVVEPAVVEPAYKPKKRTARAVAE